MPTVSMDAEVSDVGGTVGDDWAREAPQVVPEKASDPTEAKLQGMTHEGYAGGNGAVGHYPTKVKLQSERNKLDADGNWLGGQFQAKAELQGVIIEVVDADDNGFSGQSQTKAELQVVINEVDVGGEGSLSQQPTEAML